MFFYDILMYSNCDVGGGGWGWKGEILDKGGGVNCERFVSGPYMQY